MKKYAGFTYRLSVLLLVSVVCGSCAYVDSKTGGDESKTVLESVQIAEIDQKTSFDENNILWGGSVYSKKFSLNSTYLDEYANTIAKKLVASWPGPIPHYSIRVIYGNNLDAHATMNNVIFLSSGWLKGSKSEDEVAAVLAHELSHILLGHPVNKGSREDSAKTLNKFRQLVPLGLYVAKMRMKKGGSSYKLVYQGDSSDQQIIDATVYLGEILYETKQSVVDPMITRMQEEQADFLAVDLLQNAGYNSYVLRDNIMDRLQVYRENIQKEIDLKEALYKTKCDELEKQIEKDLLAGKIDAALQSTLNSLTAQLRHLTTDWFEKGQKEHFRPEVRKERLTEYHKQHYQKRPRAKIKIAEYQKMLEMSHFLEIHEGNYAAERALEKLYQDNINEAHSLSTQSIQTRARQSPFTWYVLGKVRTYQNRLPDVIENYTKAIRLGGCSPEVYGQLSELYVDQKKYTMAKSIVDKGIRAFNDDPGPFYVDKAKICIAETDYSTLINVLDECKHYPDDSISTNCTYLEKNFQEESQLSEDTTKPADATNSPLNNSLQMLEKFNPFKSIMQ